MTITVSYSTATIAEGDSPDPLVAGSNWGGTDHDMSAAGWVCHTSLHDELRETALYQDKQITDLVTDGAIQKFNVWMDLAEAELMTASGLDVCKYIWTVQIKNETLAQPYREEVDIPIKVRSGLVTT